MLLTGFQSYGGRTINPAEEIVKSLNGKIIGGQKITGKTLPVNYNELKNRRLALGRLVSGDVEKVCEVTDLSKTVSE